MLKGITLSAIFLLGIFWLDRVASNHPANYNSSTTHTEPQQSAATNPVAISQINKTKGSKTGTAKKQNKSNDFVKWIEWFFSDTNRAIAVGTLLLAIGAFFQVEVS